MVLNNVQGQKYPYFYMVIVAREGFGLRERIERLRVESKDTMEYKMQNEVEVFILRRRTTKRSGYHTKNSDVRRIFRTALDIAEKLAR